ncbi:hypothetical protein GCM10009000_063450 [Halobacterium noricense]|uniref:Uncharacterized protein n=1 Tax=Haladaptatus pallidirubidus TaxID=1008152 RepID=A0AAV3UJP9_9EURY
MIDGFHPIHTDADDEHPSIAPTTVVSMDSEVNTPLIDIVIVFEMEMNVYRDILG